MDSGEQFELLLSVLYAFGIGAAVGLEREYRGFEAGIRTSALVCAGAAMFGAIGEAFGDSRMAAGVVQGIGFLGAGLIFQRNATVHNMTTAATMWALAGVGLLLALDLWVVALGTAAAIVALLELQPVSDMVYKRGDRTAEHRDEMEGDTKHDDEDDEQQHGRDVEPEDDHGPSEARRRERSKSNA